MIRTDTSATASEQRINVIMHFDEELKRLVPTN